MASETDLMKCIARIGAAFPNFKATPMTLEVYFETLRDLDGDLLEAATLQSIAENGRAFAPAPGEIREAASSIRGTVAGVPSSYDAWGEVRRAFADYGYVGNPPWSHPLIAKAVKAMGWRDMCMSEDETATRARFIQCYEQFQKRAEADDGMLPQVRGYITDAQEQMNQLAAKMAPRLGNGKEEK